MKEGGQSVLNDLFYLIGGHFIKPLTFLRLVRLLNPFVPCSLGSSLSLFTPPLPPVNRLSIRLPPRFSVKLENSHYLKLTFSPWEMKVQFPSDSTMSSGLMLAGIRINNVHP